MAKTIRESKKARTLIHSALSLGGHSLQGVEAIKILSYYGIKVAKSKAARNQREAALVANSMGFPVVLKIISEDILHKSDVGGVKIDIGSQGELRRAFYEIIQNVNRANPRAKITGVLVQKMAPKGYEFAIGGTRDPQFGPTVMFGLGGIFIELFRDVSFRLAPVTQEEAKEMMKEIKAFTLLTGFRSSKSLDIEAIARSIVSIGSLLVEQEEIKSIDVNPLTVYPKGVLATDVRIILKKG